MGDIKPETKERIKSYGRIALDSLGILAICLVVAIILSYIIVNLGYMGALPALIFIIALINLVILFERNKNNLRYIFFIYVVTDIVFVLVGLYTIKNFTYNSTTLDVPAITFATCLFLISCVRLITN